jgi:hypothetical protein
MEMKRAGMRDTKGIAYCMDTTTKWKTWKEMEEVN